MASPATAVEVRDSESSSSSSSEVEGSSDEYWAERETKAVEEVRADRKRQREQARVDAEAIRRRVASRQAELKAKEDAECNKPALELAQKKLLDSVLELSQYQIAHLPPTQREQVRLIVAHTKGTSLPTTPVNPWNPGMTEPRCEWCQEEVGTVLRRGPWNGRTKTHGPGEYMCAECDKTAPHYAAL